MKSGLKSPFSIVTIALLLSLAGAACGSDGEAEPEEATAETTAAEENDPGEVAAGGTTVAVTATDFKFQIPHALPAGDVTFQLVNSGKEPHMFSLFLLTEDAPSIIDIANRPRKKAGKYLDGDELGYLDAKPGLVSKKSFTATLEPGRRYGYVCFFETNGKPHVALGMFGEFKAG